MLLCTDLIDSTVARARTERKNTMLSPSFRKRDLLAAAARGSSLGLSARVTSRCRAALTFTLCLRFRHIKTPGSGGKQTNKTLSGGCQWGFPCSAPSPPPRAHLIIVIFFQSSWRGRRVPRRQAPRSRPSCRRRHCSRRGRSGRDRRRRRRFRGGLYFLGRGWRLSLAWAPRRPKSGGRGGVDLVELGPSEALDVFASV